MSDGSLWVAHTLTSDAHWAPPYVLPGAGLLVPDDISSLVPFGPGRIGVMWTDQANERVMFASRADGEADDTWSPVEIVATGVGPNDDQLNLKTFELDGARVVATPIRTTVDVDADQNPLDAQILVMVRRADGQWTSSEAGRVQDKHNRPILLIDEGRRLMYVAAQSPTGGGIVSIKRASLDSPIFPTGPGRSPHRGDRRSRDRERHLHQAGGVRGDRPGRPGLGREHRAVSPRRDGPRRDADPGRCRVRPASRPPGPAQGYVPAAPRGR